MSGGLFTDNRPLDVTIIPRGTLGADGMYTYNGTEVETLAWVTDKTGILRKANGREVLYSRVFYFDRDAILQVGDRILYGGRNHEVLSVSFGRDITGRTNHKKVLTGAGM